MAIVCGTDFSDASLGALEVARALAAQRGDPDIALVSIIDDPKSAPSTQAALDAACAAAGPGVAIRTRIGVGEVGPELLAIAASEASDFIVIAAASTSQHMGAAAERIVTSARVPVLVLRNPEPWLAFARGTKPLRVLVSVDDSIPCELGIQWTHALRTRGPVDVVLGAVYYPDESAERYGLPAKPLVERDPDVEKLLERDLLQQFGRSDRVTARTRRGLGRIGNHVLELATEASVDAIVIGTSQKTGLGRLGSVSAVVIREGHQSVLCVPPNAKVATLVVRTVTSVLVATDLSPFANRAVSLAVGTLPQGDIHLLHVVGRDEECNEDQLASELQALAPSGTVDRIATHIVRSNDIGVAIAQAAARLGCDLICLTSRKKYGITRAVVGSVTDQVLQTTHKPVLLLGRS